jgi:hypothetical protein
MGILSVQPIPPEVRAKGRDDYIWRTGILGWGLPVSIVMTIVDLYRGKGVSLGGPPWADALATFGGALFFFGLLGGWSFGYVMWRAGTRSSLPESPPPKA